MKPHTKFEDMTNSETKAWILEYVESDHDLFSWCTDACGYEQHIKFVDHRNFHFDRVKEMSKSEWKQFVIDYANSLA